MNKTKYLIIIFIMFVCISYNLTKINASEVTNDFYYSMHYEPTLDDDFDDDTLILTLTSEYSDVNKEIVIDDFLTDTILFIEYLNVDEILCNLENYIIIENIIDLTFIDNPNQIVNSDDFCQILSVDLLNEDKKSVLAAINEYEKLDYILAAEPSYNYDVVEFSTPDDELFPEQWGLNGINGIDADLAWNFTTGAVNPPVKVGIFEKNVQLDHPDLNIIPGNFIPDSTANVDHGTHVAGIIGAVGNNTIGISGVAQVEIALLDNSSANFASSLTWAFNNGIRLVNASFGYVNKKTGMPSPANISHETAIRNFSNNGGILIASAGNDGNKSYGNTDVTPHFPSCYGDSRYYPDINNVISVGALNNNGKHYLI